MPHGPQTWLESPGNNAAAVSCVGFLLEGPPAAHGHRVQPCESEHLTESTSIPRWPRPGAEKGENKKKKKSACSHEPSPVTEI